MLSGLADPYLKTDRAKDHLDALWEQVRIFRESKPHRVSRQRDVKNQRYIIRFKIKEIPPKIPVIVGDFAYCLRSSLDQLVWALAKLKCPYPRHTQFPILDSLDDGKLKKDTRGVPSEARTIIKSLQPYNAGQASIKSHLLWKLNKLCIIDKHRRIAAHSDESFMWFPDFPPEQRHLMTTFDDACVVSVPLHLESKMRLDPDASFNIIFGDTVEGVACDIDELGTIYEFVANRVLPRFLRFFK